MRRAVVLLSGGLDSCVAATWATMQRAQVHALGVAYGQRHAVELEAAQTIASSLRIPLHLVRADLTSISSGDLFGAANVRHGRAPDAVTRNARPSTFVPARNAIFLSLAATFARTIGATSIVVGSNADDATGYPDCRREFFDAFESVSRAGGFEVQVESPLVTMTKRQVVEFGRAIHAPIEASWSCYSPREVNGRVEQCRLCDACSLRFAAMGEGS